MNDIGACVTAALADRPRDCPGCNRRLHMPEQIAVVGGLMMPDAQSGESTFTTYLLCTHCGAGGSELMLRRIERRLQKEPGRYAIRCAPLMQAMTGTELHQMVPHRLRYRAADNDDAAWFAAHPDRTHRLREPLPCDDGMEDATHVLVQQLRPGMRLRMGMVLTGPLPAWVEQDDNELMLLADSLARRQGGMR